MATLSLLQRRSAGVGVPRHLDALAFVALLVVAPLLWAPGCSDDDDPTAAPGPADVEPADGGGSDAGPADSDLATPPVDVGFWPDTAAHQERRPSLQRIAPAQGHVDGGDSVVLYGAGFIYAREVRFGGQAAPEFQVHGPDRLTAVTPPGELGTVDVSVRSEGGVAVLVGAFRYVDSLVVTSVDPPVASTSGGTSVVVRGHGLSRGVEVLVGSGRAWGAVAQDDGRLRVQLPPNPPGEADLWAFVDGERAVLRRAVLYVAPPSVDSVLPSFGPVAGGTLVELRGRALGPVGDLSLGGVVVPAAAQTVDDGGTWLRFTTPGAGAPGAADLLLRTGTGEVLVPSAFAYVGSGEPPELWAVRPGQGSLVGGDRVRLLGEGLEPSGTVRFGAHLADCEPGTSNERICTVPPGEAAGPIAVTIKQAPDVVLELPVGYVYQTPLELHGVFPGSAPEAGGVAVELRGVGFAAGLSVTFGGVPATGVRVHAGGVRASCVVPPGSPGPVNVTLRQGGRDFTLGSAFVYEGALRVLAVDPPTGSIAGDTWVRLIGSGLHAGLTVLIGDQPATELELRGPTTLALRTPPAVDEGPVDVQIPGQALLPSGFEYYDPYTGGGGVWGGPIESSANVAVRNSYTGDPIPGATVLLGPDGQTRWQGLTDERGLITLSGPGLTGPVDVHAGHPDFEPSGFLGTNGRNASFFLIPKVPPSTPGGGPGEIEEVDGVISGFLSGLDKYILLPDDPAWERVAYVETTRAGLYGGNPAPGPEGTLATDGPYRIVSRPGDVAVVAIAGLLNVDTREFVPMRMGFHRFLFMPIRGELDEVDVVLDVRLSHRVAVRLHDPPYDFERGPDTLRLKSWLQIEPEGYYHPHNEISGPRREFWLAGLPDPAAFAVDDVRLHIESGLYTGATRPYSLAWTEDVPLAAEELTIGPFAGIPRLVAPTSTLPLGPERSFTWTIDGGAEPDVYSVRMLGPELEPAWRLIFAGPARSFSLPYRPGIFEIPVGRQYLAVTAGVAPSFLIDEFQYSSLSVRGWQSWAVDYADFLHAAP